ncbi:DUF4426 domain-containing protein [Marinimicrobium sp. ABcell2]|uniref:DUF4426 domain-containing protein n=1 Tax=Marinimicrobium sp. ABcell2 TaxID=3069751 RepID=UPI0027B387CA|nr:DUF4426 domain-containing protein [Marinimicrobium sp. ABcell2]MDQ2076594.1 DUF4426 domain-containing protein [Marinimicrobium sp. ABcell2]
MSLLRPYQCAAALLMLLFSLSAIAQTGSQQFGDYTVQYSVFNSTFIEPDIAETYGLVRAADRTLINVSVTKSENGASTLGLPAEVRGTAANLLQQQQQLDFKEMSDGQATYYIATLRHSHEETFNITLQVQPEPERAPFEMKFSRTLYVDGR